MPRRSLHDSAWALLLLGACAIETPDPNGRGGAGGTGAGDVTIGGSSGGSGSGRPPDALPACGLLFDGSIPDCEACFEKTCCEQGRACVDQGDCIAVIDCVTACGRDTTCDAKCADAHVEGTKTLRAIFTCTDAACAAVCPVPM